MRRYMAVLVALLLLVALAAGGCGSKKKNAGGSSGNLTADQVSVKGLDATKNLKSAAFKMDMTLNVKADTAKMTDQSTAALLAKPITLTGSGNISNEQPQKLDATLAIGAGGMTINAGMKFDGQKAWVDVMDTWYELPAETMSALTGGASPGASPGNLTDQLSTLGIDTSSWISAHTLLGNEQIDGTDCYHLSDTVDMAALSQSLGTLMQSAGSLSSVLGGTSTGTSQKDLKAAQDAIKQLQTMLKDVKLDAWYETGTFDMRKLTASATMDFSAVPDAAKQGLQSGDFKFELDLSNFGESVTVTPPANAKPFDQLIGGLGSLTGGSTATALRDGHGVRLGSSRRRVTRRV